MKHLSLGSLIDGRYRLDDQVGAGGMGIVYRARDMKLDRDVAIKFLLGERLGPRFRARFTEEARILSRLEHQNILQLFDFGSAETTPYIVCEFLDGRTIIDHVEMTGPLPLNKVKEWSTQLFSAISYAHSKGILHRDLKGENVMVTSAGEIRVMDFGLARRDDRATKLTETGAVMGTATYVSPEVIMGSPATQASDVYSAGIILYEMLVGNPPFEGTTSFDVLQAHLMDIPPDPTVLREELPKAVAHVLSRALEKKPNKRYSSIALFGEHFIAALEGRTLATVDNRKKERKRSSFLIKKSGTFAPISEEPRRYLMPLLFVPALLFLGAFLIYPLLTTSSLPDKKEEIRWDIRPQSATVSWQSGGNKVIPYSLRLSGKQVARGNSRRDGQNQEISLRGLLPGRTYDLVLGTSSKNLMLELSTPKPKFSRLPYTAVLNDTFFIDYATNLDRGLQLIVTKPHGAILAKKKNCPPSGNVILTDLDVGPLVRPLNYELTLDNKVLARGTAYSRPQLTQGPIYPDAKKFRVFNRTPRVGPFWLGKYFLYADHNGTLFCYELNRTTRRDQKDPCLKLSWLMAPRLHKGVLHIHRQVLFKGLTKALLYVVILDTDGKLTTRVIDIAARAEEWRKRTEGKKVSVYPHWTLDATDSWNATIGKREWLTNTKGSSANYFTRTLAPAKQCFVAQGMKRTNLIFAAFHESNGQLLWEQKLTLGDLLKAPYHQVKAEGAPFAMGKEGIQERGKFWDYLSRPLVSKGRLFTLVAIGGRIRTSKGQLRPCALLSVPLSAKADEGPLVCFRFHVLARRLELSSSADGKKVFVNGPDFIYQWEIGQQTPPDYLPTSSLFADGRLGYNSGRVLSDKNRTYFTRYQFLTSQSAPNGGLVGNLFSSPHLCTIEGKEQKRFLVRYNPTLLEETDERPGQIIDMILHGDHLLAQSRRAMICVDTKTLAWTNYTIHNLERTTGFDISDEGIIGTAHYNGCVTAIPFAALKVRLQGQLNANMRIPIPSNVKALRSSN